LAERNAGKEACTKEIEEKVMEKLRLLRKIYYLSPLVKIGCTSKMKINRNLFCISLGFHYLCNQVLANRHNMTLITIQI